MEDYKEKLRLAKEALDSGSYDKDTIEYIFPELRESEDERIRKAIVQLVEISEPSYTLNVFGLDKKDMLAWLEKQGGCSVKWNKNTEDNKPQINHSVLMQTTHGIAEGEWQGEQWHQYRWASIVRDTDVLSWIELSSLEKRCEQKFPSLSEKEIVCLKRALDFLREEHNSYTGKDFTNEIAVLEWLITHPVLINSSELQQNQGEQKPAWSEEDEEMLNDIIQGLTATEHLIFKHDAQGKTQIQGRIEWLKSIKERVQSQNK